MIQPRPRIPSPRQVSFWLLDLGQPRTPSDHDRARTAITDTHGLEADYDAVLATLRLPWSQGQVEGQVNRLKLIKRSM